MSTEKTTQETIKKKNKIHWEPILGLGVSFGFILLGIITPIFNETYRTGDLSLFGSGFCLGIGICFIIVSILSIGTHISKEIDGPIVIDGTWIVIICVQIFLYIFIIPGFFNDLEILATICIIVISLTLIGSCMALFFEFKKAKREPIS